MGDYIYHEARYEPWPDAPEVPESYEGVITNAFGYEPVEGLELGGSDAGFWRINAPPAGMAQAPPLHRSCLGFRWPAQCDRVVPPAPGTAWKSG